MDRELDEPASAEEPLLTDEERGADGGDQRIPWQPPPSEYLGTKVKYFRRLQKDWVSLSPPAKAAKPPSVYPPPHVLPPAAFVRGASEENLAQFNHGSHERVFQSSWATVFSIWNTMIGSTLVALPYGFSCSGVLLGIGIVILVGVICCYTCNLVVRYGKDFPDFGDLMQYHFGQRAQAVTLSVSVFVLLGACIAYHVLMKQCAYTVLHAAFDWLHIQIYWSPPAAALVVCVLFPLTNLKEFSTLVFLNSFGIPFLIFTIYFITFHGIQAIATHAPMDEIEFGAKSTFGVLGGIVTLSFFIHNAIQPIIRNSNPANYSRDVTAAYVLVGLSYTAVGVLGYIGFPRGLPIQQNFLDAFPVADVFAFAARVSLLLQLATVYPLFFLIIRTQVFGLLYQNTWPSTWRVVLLNVAIMTTTTLFAVYYPNVGDILRFTGAVGGLVLIFLAPIGLHWKHQRAKRLWTWGSFLLHGAIVLVGVTLLALQFVH